MSSRWTAYPDALGAATACTQFLTAMLLQELDEQDTATLALSGGTSPKPLLIDLVDSPIAWDRVHIFWVDERAVPPTDPASNYLLAEELFLKPARFPMENVHRIQAELGAEEAAAIYREDLRAHFGLADGAMPRFSVMHLGMGPDAHTASLFPGEPLIEDRTGLAAALYVEKHRAHRITLLPGVILAAKHISFLAGGEDKAEPLRQVLEGEYAPSRYPAQVVARNAEDVAWFVDQPAASLLTKVE